MKINWESNHGIRALISAKILQAIKDYRGRDKIHKKLAESYMMDNKDRGVLSFVGGLRYLGIDVGKARAAVLHKRPRFKV